MIHWDEIGDPHGYINAIFQIENLYFETGKAIIKTESHENLDKLYNSLNTYPDIKLMVHGHTDKTGGIDLNMKLSKDRAESVKGYLVGKGIAADRILTKGHGPKDPLINGESESEFKFNRRVEFEYTL